MDRNFSFPRVSLHNCTWDGFIAADNNFSPNRRITKERQTNKQQHDAPHIQQHSRHQQTQKDFCSFRRRRRRLERSCSSSINNSIISYTSPLNSSKQRSLSHLRQFVFSLLLLLCVSVGRQRLATAAEVKTRADADELGDASTLADIFFSNHDESKQQDRPQGLSLLQQQKLEHASVDDADPCAAQPAASGAYAPRNEYYYETVIRTPSSTFGSSSKADRSEEVQSTNTFAEYGRSRDITTSGCQDCSTQGEEDAAEVRYLFFPSETSVGSSRLSHTRPAPPFEAVAEQTQTGPLAIEKIGAGKGTDFRLEELQRTAFTEEAADAQSASPPSLPRSCGQKQCVTRARSADTTIDAVSAADKNGSVASTPDWRRSSSSSSSAEDEREELVMRADGKSPRALQRHRMQAISKAAMAHRRARDWKPCGLHTRFVFIFVNPDSGDGSGQQWVRGVDSHGHYETSFSDICTKVHLYNLRHGHGGAPRGFSLLREVATTRQALAPALAAASADAAAAHARSSLDATKNSAADRDNTPKNSDPVADDRCAAASVSNVASTKTSTAADVRVPYTPTFDASRASACTASKSSSRRGERRRSLIRVIAVGGDGTISWVNKSAAEADVPEDWLAVGIVGFGTGNDFAQSYGWSHIDYASHSIYEGDTLKKHVIMWQEACVARHDMWHIEVKVDSTGSFEHIDSKRKKLKKLLNPTDGNPLRTFSGFMTLYFGLGLEAQVGLDFDINRSRSRLKNRITYGLSFVKQMNKKWTFITNQIKNVYLMEGNVKRVFLTTSGEEYPHAFRLPPSVSMTFINTHTIMGGVRVWTRSKRVGLEPPEYCSNNRKKKFDRFVKRLIKAEQHMGDKKLELFAFRDRFSLMRSILYERDAASRLMQHRGPFLISFYSTEHAGPVAFQIDGEFFRGNHVTSVEVRYLRTFNALRYSKSTHTYHSKAHSARYAIKQASRVIIHSADLGGASADNAAVVITPITRTTVVSSGSVDDPEPHSQLQASTEPESPKAIQREMVHTQKFKNHRKGASPYEGGGTDRSNKASNGGDASAWRRLRRLFTKNIEVISALVLGITTVAWFTSSSAYQSLLQLFKSPQQSDAAVEKTAENSVL